MNSERRTRANSQVWLVGTVNSSITQEGRLPTLRDVLSVFFYRHIEEKLTWSESADIAVMELLKIWKKSGIPTKAQSLIAVPEDWKFLVAQREDRRGYMAGIDRDAERKKEISNKKEQDIKKRKQRSDREVAALLEKETCELSCESSTPEQSDEEYNHVGPRKKKLCQLESQSPNLITKDVAAALDCTKVSDREAVYLLASAAHALGHDVQQLPVSRSSIRRARI
ncbi:hypothetical protein Bpfe_015263 [Biomphalaria pfeifferi]|uniref:Uncharacterized protein n=1 Tax=Biomphalaria pfeifferi TaxID=112525 RepID=A0AAD8F9R0_BIOPF|nr:hypothetical protein Bpfe_015263 [Biomphalaria pfeifferi]